MVDTCDFLPHLGGGDMSIGIDRGVCILDKRRIYLPIHTYLFIPYLSQTLISIPIQTPLSTVRKKSKSVLVGTYLSERFTSH